jgi:hypothetical protein
VPLWRVASREGDMITYATFTQIGKHLVDRVLDEGGAGDGPTAIILSSRVGTRDSLPKAPCVDLETIPERAVRADCLTASRDSRGVFCST